MTLNNCTVTIGQYVEHQTVGTQYVDKQVVGEETPPAPLGKGENGREGEGTKWLWPLYGDNASEEDRKTFEDFLHQLCARKNRSMTHDIHTYLDVKAKEGLIRRPSQQNIEYEWVKKFGYPYQAGAYYKG